MLSHCVIQDALSEDRTRKDADAGCFPCSASAVFFNGDVSRGSVQGFGFGSEREPATAIQIANCILKVMTLFVSLLNVQWNGNLDSVTNYKHRLC
jgi:hypothetical protein